MHSCKATLPTTPKIKENNGHKRKHEERKPFKDANNNMKLSKKKNKKKKKEAVLNSNKLAPKSRTKESNNNKTEGEKTILPVRYTSNNMLLLKKAMKNSMKKKGGKEAKFANKMSIIRPKGSQKRPRRQAFQIRPSRLSTVSDAQDLPITQPGKGPIVVDLEENEESLVSNERPRPTAIKVNRLSNLMMSNISKKQSAELALTSEERKMRIKKAKFSPQAPKENVATLDPQTTRATFRSNHDAYVFFCLV